MGACRLVRHSIWVTCGRISRPRNQTSGPTSPKASSGSHPARSKMSNPNQSAAPDRPPRHHMVPARHGARNGPHLTGSAQLGLRHRLHLQRPIRQIRRSSKRCVRQPDRATVNIVTSIRGSDRADRHCCRHCPRLRSPHPCPRPGDHRASPAGAPVSGEADGNGDVGVNAGPVTEFAIVSKSPAICLARGEDGAEVAVTLAAGYRGHAGQVP